MSPPEQRSSALHQGETFRRDIEGMRAVAVLLVVGCHCGIAWLAGGFVGVDVFFVLSGYLITGLLAAEYRATSDINFREFYARRARRLLPACALMLLLTVLAAGALNDPQALESTARAGLAASVYVSNIFFDGSASNYFAPHEEANPLLHTWSLGLEEQFYLVWPLLILAASQISRRFRGSIWMLCLVSALSFIFSLYIMRWSRTAAFYELPARAWEFSAGGLLALLRPSNRTVNSTWAIASGGVGLVMILGTAVLVTGGAGFPGWIALLPVIGTLAILFAGEKAPRRGVSAVLSIAPLQFVGARSYSWYLWHWPFVVFAATVAPSISVSGKIGAVLASLVIASLAFRYVELPIRNNRALKTRAGLSLAGGAGAAALTVAASWLLLEVGRQQLSVDGRYQIIGDATADVADKFPKTCWSEGYSFEAKMCEFGPAGAPALVLFGDSHAMQWVTAMRTATTEEGWRLVTIVRPGCAASDINPLHLSPVENHCKEWRSAAINKIIALHPSAVVMASYNGTTIRAAAPPITNLLSVDEVRSGTRSTLELLSHAGAPVVVLRDTPLPPFNIPACVARRLGGKLRAGESCDFDAGPALNDAASAAEHGAATGLKDVYFLDLNDLICPTRSCPATQRDLIVYRDEDHLTGTFAASLAPSVRTRLFSLLRNSRSVASAELTSIQ